MPNNKFAIPTTRETPLVGGVLIAEDNSEMGYRPLGQVVTITEAVKLVEADSPHYPISHVWAVGIGGSYERAATLTCNRADVYVEYFQ